MSSFSVDLIDALGAGENFVCVYMFCGNENADGGLEMTPTMIVQRVICEVLLAFPKIVIEHVALFSLQRFQRVKGNGMEAWKLLVEILEVVQEVCLEKKKELYIIVDRLDLCAPDEGFDVRKCLIPRLQEISQRWRNMRVVLTSTVMAERVGTLRGEEGWLTDVWLDTKSAVGMDEVDGYDDWD